MDITAYLVFSCIVLFDQVTVTVQTTSASETTLRSTLASGYDTNVRPTTPTPVTGFYTIRSLQQLDIAGEVMDSTGWITLMWSDHRLVWDGSTHSNIEYLDLDWTWRPKFFIGNRVSDLSFFGQKSTVVRVHSSGTVRWAEPLQLSTVCSVDITRFPFDTQTCNIELVFWNHAEHEIDVFASRQIATSVYVPNGEWRLVSTSTIKESVPFCCPDETAPAFNLTFSFQRMRPYYVMNLLLPTLLMSVCIVLTFLLPAESGEKIGYSITIMLTYVVLLTITTDLLPSTSLQTPFIASYIMVILIYALGSVALTVINVMLFNKTGSPPNFVQYCFRYLGTLAFCDCRCRKGDKVGPANQPYSGTTKSRATSASQRPDETAKVDHESNSTLKASESDVRIDDVGPETEVTWREVSAIMDRLFFYIYFINILIFNIILLVALNGSEVGALSF